MIKALTIFLLSAATLLAPPVQIRIIWEPDSTNGLLESSFNIYASDSITNPLSTWPLLTNIWATNAMVGPTNCQASITVTQGQRFYYVTQSNFWESGPSNVANTPPLLNNPKLKISR